MDKIPEFKTPKIVRMIRNLSSNWRFSFFTFSKLPIMWFSGAKVKDINEDHVIISIPYRWSTKNPFSSVYFAAQSGAAELSTGIAVLIPAEHFGNMSMLITSFKAEFYKKAQTGLVFVCNDILEAWKAVEKANVLEDGVNITLISNAYNLENELIARFKVEWSIRKRRN